MWRQCAKNFCRPSESTNYTKWHEYDYEMTEMLQDGITEGRSNGITEGRKDGRRKTEDGAVDAGAIFNSQLSMFRGANRRLMDTEY